MKTAGFSDRGITNVNQGINLILRPIDYVQAKHNIELISSRRFRKYLMKITASIG